MSRAVPLDVGLGFTIARPQGMISNILLSIGLGGSQLKGPEATDMLLPNCYRHRTGPGLRKGPTVAMGLAHFRHQAALMELWEEGEGWLSLISKLQA